MKCVICNELNIDHPELDAATGFDFCVDCMHAAKQVWLIKYNAERNISAWLRAIADTRDKTIKKY